MTDKPELYRIYTIDLCGYCTMAKNLLDQYSIKYTEYNLESHPHHRDELLKEAPDARTVPQIFIGKKLIGGYDDLRTYVEECIESAR